MGNLNCWPTKVKYHSALNFEHDDELEDNYNDNQYLYAKNPLFTIATMDEIELMNLRDY